MYNVHVILFYLTNNYRIFILIQNIKPNMPCNEIFSLRDYPQPICVSKIKSVTVTDQSPTSEKWQLERRSSEDLPLKEVIDQEFGITYTIRIPDDELPVIGKITKSILYTITSVKICIDYILYLPVLLQYTIHLLGIVAIDAIVAYYMCLLFTD